ncbi:MAG: ATP-binding protein [Planctomycetota bacterium]
MSSIWEWMDDPRIIVLVGSRQVGKTCILYLLIKQLMRDDVKPNSIFYFDLEDFEVLNLFNSGVRDFLRYLEIQGMKSNERSYIFVDEIQYMDNPSNFLKLIADHHKNLKFICSGSSTLEVRRKFTDSLAGRKIVFEIPTLTFSEYLLFKGEELLLKLLKDYPFDDIGEPPLDIHRKQLKAHYEQYIIYGGYPAVILEDGRERKLRLLHEIYESYVRKDINQLFTVENLIAFNNLVRMLALQIGNLINLQELTTSLSISRPTVEKYLLALENTFILKRIPPFFVNKRKEIVKMPKVYYHDTGMRNQVVRNFQPLSLRPDAGAIVENSVFKSLNARISLLEELKFWRMKNGSEVDFIVEGEQLVPIEVKYTTMNSPRIPPGIRSFIQSYNPSKAIVVTKDYIENVEVNGSKVIFIPVYLLS